MRIERRDCVIDKFCGRSVYKTVFAISVGTKNRQQQFCIQPVETAHVLTRQAIDLLPIDNGLLLIHNDLFFLASLRIELFPIAI